MEQVSAAPEADELAQDNIPESKRRERELTVPEEFDPIALLHDERIMMGPGEREELANILTSFGARTARFEENAALRAFDYEDGSNELKDEHSIHGALQEKTGRQSPHASLRAALFLVSEYLDGKGNGAPLLLDGKTHNVIFASHDGAGISIKTEKDWEEPGDPQKSKVVIDFWGKQHGPLMFGGKTRFLTSKE